MRLNIDIVCTLIEPRSPSPPLILFFCTPWAFKKETRFLSDLKHIFKEVENGNFFGHFQAKIDT